MQVMRKIIEINEELCNGCGQCVPDCAEGALEIIDGKARLVAEKYCDGLGACLGGCPTGALQVIERQAEDFDEEAVEELLAARKSAPPEEQSPPSAQPETMACGCASSHIQSFGPALSPCQAANQPRSTTGTTMSAAAGAAGAVGVAGAVGDAAASPYAKESAPTPSALTHWPIQIRLVPPEAPFLKGAELLVAADCVPASYPDFNRELLPGKALLLGCPKFDDAESYVAKFAEIFKTAGPKGITIAIMEVPCCGSMRGIIQAAQQRAGTNIPVHEVVVGVRGNRI